MSRWYSSTGPRGVRIIADLEILMGIAYVFLGVVLLLPFLVLPGVGVIALGVILVYMGWALDKLEIWAWWGSILINVFVCIGNWIFAGEYILIIVSAAIIIYLMTPGIRSRFFE